MPMTLGMTRTRAPDTPDLAGRPTCGQRERERERERGNV